MEIRIIEQNDAQKLKNLIDCIEAHVVNPQWWLPIKKEAYDNFLNPEWTLFLGAFEKEELVGASALFFNEFEYGESLSAIAPQPIPVAEIGRCMVRPSFRGHNIMLTLNRKLLEIAKERKIRTLIATAHPDNIASNTSLQALGMKIVKCIDKDHGFLRNVLLIKVDL